MITTLLQIFVEMHENWGIDREPEITPARRHRCEICKRIFECHLCTIGYTHKIHHTDHPKALPETLMLICEECAQNPNHRYQPRFDPRGHVEYFTDMLTGESKKEQERILCRLKSHQNPAG